MCARMDVVWIRMSGEDGEEDEEEDGSDEDERERMAVRWQSKGWIGVGEEDEGEENNGMEVFGL